jgi:putative oxidoreductase
MEARMFATPFRNDSASPSRINLVALILRVVLAVIFIYHGLGKITSGDGGAYWVGRVYEQIPEQQIPASLTFSGTQLAVAWGEFLGGIALAVGLLTRWAAIGLIIIQIGAVCLVTAPRGFHFEKGGGYEYNLSLLAMCLSLLILGAGAWSVDCLLARRRMRAAGQTAAPAPSFAGPHSISGQPIEPVTPGQSRTM